MAGAGESATFAEHLSELRKRFMWILLFVAVGGGIGYALHDKLLQILQRPLNDSLYYTNPGGAFSFVMKLCVVFGIIVAIPVLSYHVFAFFGPLIAKRTKRMTVLYISMSVILAIAGILFAYFVSLPASLHFLTTFGSGDIQAIITANEYFNFVLAYVAGFAILFQVPLVIMFINRMTPLPPKKLLGGTRYVIVISFILAAVITPTPDPMNQAIMAGPIIALYIFSIALVALQPKRFKQRKQEKMAAKREWLEKQFEPIAKAQPQQLRPIAIPQPAATRSQQAVAGLRPSPQPTATQVRPHIQPRVISDFAPRPAAIRQTKPQSQVRRAETPTPSRPFVDITVRRPNIIGA